MIRNSTFFSWSRLALLSTCLLLVASSCTDDPEPQQAMGQIELSAGPSINGNQVELDQQVTTSGDVRIEFNNFRVYISDIVLVHANGNRVDLSEVLLFDPAFDDLDEFEFDIPVGEYVSIEYAIGLDSELNDSDPTSFPQAHPLSTYQGMYWSMLKYRFALIEGRANNASNPMPNDILITYHPGTDPAYRSASRPVSFVLNEGAELNLRFSFDINEIFDGDGGSIDPLTENSTHSAPPQMPFTLRLMDNLAGSVFVEATID